VTRPELQASPGRLGLQGPQAVVTQAVRGRPVRQGHQGRQAISPAAGGARRARLARQGRQAVSPAAGVALRARLASLARQGRQVPTSFHPHACLIRYALVACCHLASEAQHKTGQCQVEVSFDTLCWVCHRGWRKHGTRAAGLCGKPWGSRRPRWSRPGAARAARELRQPQHLCQRRGPAGRAGRPGQPWRAWLASRPWLQHHCGAAGGAGQPWRAWWPGHCRRARQPRVAWRGGRAGAAWGSRPGGGARDPGRGRRGTRDCARGTACTGARCGDAPDTLRKNDTAPHDCRCQQSLCQAEAACCGPRAYQGSR
jgi:hypothetical protein